MTGDSEWRLLVAGLGKGDIVLKQWTDLTEVRTASACWSTISVHGAGTAAPNNGVRVSNKSAAVPKGTKQ